MCMNVFLAYRLLYHMHAGVHGNQQKASDPLGRYIDICQIPDAASGNETWVLLKNSECP